MYIGYVSDRTRLNYKALQDTSCGIKLVQVTDSTIFLLRNLPSNVTKKSKKLVVILVLTNGVLFSSLEPAKGINLQMPHMPPPPLEITQPNSRYEVKIAPTVISKLDKIIYAQYKDYAQYKELPLSIYVMDEKILKKLQQIRGGDLAGFLLVVVAYYVIVRVLGAAFFSNNPNPELANPVRRINGVPFQPYENGYGPQHNYPPLPFRPQQTLGSDSSSTALAGSRRPTSTPHQEFVGLSKEERRMLPHDNDMRIIYEGRPELEIGFWQAEFKVADHGAIHGLPYTEKTNGGTKTPKSEENTLKFMKSRSVV